MDMSEFCGTNFLKLGDVQRDGPFEETIAEVRRGNYDRPDAIFESGNVLSLNVTSTRALVKAYGTDSRDWTGKVIKIFAGQVDFGKIEDDGDDKSKADAILVEPITPPTSDGKLPPPKPRPEVDDFNDGIPF